MHQINTNEISTKEEFLSSLRSETSYYHKALEDLPVSKKLTDSGIRESDYILYLQKMYHVVHDFESNFLPLLNGIVPDIESRKRLHLITGDLLFLKAEIPAPIKVFLPVHTAVTPAIAWGIMYVMEGSTLGGRIILKNITKNLSLNGGMNFFNGYGEKTSAYWKIFLEEFLDYKTKTNTGDEIISSAVYGFKSIHDFFLNYTIYK